MTTAAVELIRAVTERRPSVARGQGDWIETFDLTALSATVAKAADDDVVLIERIACDPRQPATFGSPAPPMGRPGRSAS